MADPFDALSQPVRPLAPDPRFASALRRRLAAVLGHPPTPQGGAVTIIPYLSCTDARRAIEWYQEAFGAVLDGDPIVMPDGTIGHSELMIGGARIMVAGEHEPEDVRSPDSLGGTTVQLQLTVPDVDAVFDRAVAAGARVWRAVTDTPYGTRGGKIRDPYGHNWFIETPLAEPAVAAPKAAEPTIGYFTIWTPDDERARVFLGDVLGWSFDVGGVPRGWHIVGAVPGGGLWGGKERSELVALFTVDDVDAAVARVRELGGRADEPEDMPYGRSANCVDDQGLRFDLLQPG